MIALYEGKSWLSLIIEKWHRSKYSHASEIADDFSSEIEAYRKSGHWFSGCVQDVKPFSNHSPGTRVSLYELRNPLTSGERQALWHFLRLQVGKPYDYAGLFGFITRRENAGEGQDKWFCGELTFAAYLHIKRPLLNGIDAHKVFPSMLSYSTELMPVLSAALP